MKTTLDELQTELNVALDPELGERIIQAEWREVLRLAEADWLDRKLAEFEDAMTAKTGDAR